MSEELEPTHFDALLHPEKFGGKKRVSRATKRKRFLAAAAVVLVGAGAAGALVLSSRDTAAAVARDCETVVDRFESAGEKLNTARQNADDALTTANQTTGFANASGASAVLNDLSADIASAKEINSERTPSCATQADIDDIVAAIKSMESSAKALDASSGAVNTAVEAHLTVQAASASEADLTKAIADLDTAILNAKSALTATQGETAIPYVQSRTGAAKISSLTEKVAEAEALAKDAKAFLEGDSTDFAEFTAKGTAMTASLTTGTASLNDSFAIYTAGLPEPTPTPTPEDETPAVDEPANNNGGYTPPARPVRPSTPATPVSPSQTTPAAPTTTPPATTPTVDPTTPPVVEPTEPPVDPTPVDPVTTPAPVDPPADPEPAAPAGDTPAEG